MCVIFYKSRLHQAPSCTKLHQMVHAPNAPTAPSSLKGWCRVGAGVGAEGCNFLHAGVWDAKIYTQRQKGGRATSSCRLVGSRRGVGDRVARATRYELRRDRADDGNAQEHGQEHLHRPMQGAQGSSVGMVGCEPLWDITAIITTSN